MFEVRRGTLIQFNSADWTALVLLDGADLEALMPVAEWVQAQMLDVDDELAVLVFGGTNTDDGIVLGPYGAVGLQDLDTAAAPGFTALTLTTTDTAVGAGANVLILVHNASSGTPGAGMGVTTLLEVASTTTPGRLVAADQNYWVDATDATRKARRDLSVYDTAQRLALRLEASGSAAMIGFLGAAAVARASAYTQTYATTTRTHANVTAVDPAAYAAGANGYSTGAMAQAVHAEVIALRADLVVVKNLLNSVIDDLQALGLVG